MKIYLASGNAMDGSAYLGEILSAYGLCSYTIGPSGGILAQANPASDVVVLARGSEESPRIESFTRAGGTVVAFQPDATIERLAGLSRRKVETALSRLRFVQPVCDGAQGEPLWTHGPVHQYEFAQGLDALAYLSIPGDPTSDAYGIVNCPIGKGNLIIYAYDLVHCIARLRQGYPERANILPGTQRTPRSAFLQAPNAPADTHWRPTADLHASAFCELIRRSLARSAPVPALWKMPGGSPSILLYSGDEDNCPQAGNDEEMRDVEAAGGSMNLYVIPDLTSISRTDMETYTRRGHAISVHPNLVPTAGEPPAKQLETAEAQVALFKEKYDWPARTVRNHFYMWPGYLELPEIWERSGIGMDANSCATLHYDSLEYGPYLNTNAAMPLRFVREDGSLIDVYQQPTHINDDLAVHPTKFYSMKYSAGMFEQIARRIFKDAATLFHGPVCANVHPGNYIDFSGPHGRILMQLAKQHGMPIWSLDRWHDFWRARATWKLAGCTWDGSTLRFQLSGEPCNGLSLHLPARFDDVDLIDVLINGASAARRRVGYECRESVQIDLPAGERNLSITASYNTSRSK